MGEGLKTRARILIIEDDPVIVEFLKTGLTYEGFEVEASFEGREGMERAMEESFDVIILDVMLPDMDGFEVCSRLRKGEKMGVPILMLTVKKDVKDRVRGLDVGADDYVTKPFSFEELLARIRALMRRAGGRQESHVLRVGDISLDLHSRQVKKGNNIIELTPTEFSLLKLFMQHPRRVFTRDTLVNRVLGYDYEGNTNVIDVHISHLRKKLGDFPPHRVIRTIYGVGYAFYPG